MTKWTNWQVLLFSLRILNLQGPKRHSLHFDFKFQQFLLKTFFLPFFTLLTNSRLFFLYLAFSWSFLPCESSHWIFSSVSLNYYSFRLFIHHYHSSAYSKQFIFLFFFEELSKNLKTLKYQQIFPSTSFPFLLWKWEENASSVKEDEISIDWKQVKIEIAK